MSFDQEALFELPSQGKTYVLMDIDGVLSPLGYISDRAISFPLQWGSVVIRAKVLEWFRTLLKRPHVEVVWCTMRHDEAHIITQRMGVSDLRVLDVGIYKDSAISEFIRETGTPFDRYIWVDDDFEGIDDTDFRRKVHCYQVDPDNGLTREDMEFIDQFCHKSSR